MFARRGRVRVAPDHLPRFPRIGGLGDTHAAFGSRQRAGVIAIREVRGFRMVEAGADGTQFQVGGALRGVGEEVERNGVPLVSAVLGNIEAGGSGIPAAPVDAGDGVEDRLLAGSGKTGLYVQEAVDARGTLLPAQDSILEHDDRVRRGYVHGAVAFGGSGVDIDPLSRGRQVSDDLPAFGCVPGTVESGLLLFGDGRKQRVGIARIDGQGLDHRPRTVARLNLLLGVIPGYDDPGNVVRLRIDEFPGFALVLAAVQPVGRDIEDVAVHRVQHDEACDAPEVEHAPGTSTVGADVSSGHVAVDQHQIGIDRTYGGIELRASSAGSDHLPGAAASLARRRAKRAVSSERNETMRNLFNAVPPIPGRRNPVADHICPATWCT